MILILVSTFSFSQNRPVRNPIPTSTEPTGLEKITVTANSWAGSSVFTQFITATSLGDVSEEMNNGQTYLITGSGSDISAVLQSHSYDAGQNYVICNFDRDVGGFSSTLMSEIGGNSTYYKFIDNDSTNIGDGTVNLLPTGDAPDANTVYAHLLALTDTLPYLTFHNTSHGDVNASRASQLIFQGEQSGGELSTLGKIEFSHHSTGDDQKGQLLFLVNSGTDDDSPSEMFSLTTDHFTAGIPDEWGIYSNRANMYLQSEESINIGDIEGVASETILEINSTSGKFVFNNGDVGIGVSSPSSSLDVAGGIKISNDSDAASSDKAGTLRYRVSGNNSYLDMCMQTGASTYTWVNIKTNSW